FVAKSVVVARVAYYGSKLRAGAQLVFPFFIQQGSQNVGATLNSRRRPERLLRKCRSPRHQNDEAEADEVTKKNDRHYELSRILIPALWALLGRFGIYLLIDGIALL